MSAPTNLTAHESDESRLKELTITVSSWVIVAWMCYIFLGSLPYKFSDHPDTQHIFGTIGTWLSGLLGSPVGNLFTQFGAYAVGTAELFTSLLLLSPIAYWLRNRARAGYDVDRFRAQIHAIGGLMASAVMAGAVFFHLFTPLGINVLHNGQSDGGSLFRAAVSILVLGIVMFFMNKSRGFQNWRSA